MVVSTSILYVIDKVKDPLFLYYSLGRCDDTWDLLFECEAWTCGIKVIFWCIDEIEEEEEFKPLSMVAIMC